MRHQQVQSFDLSTPAFYSLYSGFFQDSYESIEGDLEDFTEFRCETGFVTHAKLTFKTAFCLRRYQRMEGLYDVLFKAAALGQDHRGLETGLQLSAVSFDNAKLLARRHLEAIEWAE